MGPPESKVEASRPGLSSRDALGKAPRQGSLLTRHLKDWQIPLNSWPRKFVAIVLVLITGGILIYRTWGMFLAAWMTRSKIPDPAIYERAIRYDPGNADYHFILGNIYNYSTQYLNISRAGEQYEAAVRLNPYASAYWLELSKYYEQSRKIERSVDAMKMALQRDPNYAQTHWAAANFYIRLDDLKSADFELRRTADLDVGYLTQALDLVWHFYEDPERIMSTHVPNSKDANLIALNYFIGQKNETGAGLAWSRLKAFTTSVPERFAYIDYLVSSGKPHDAWNVFSFPSGNTSSLIYNSSFETEPMNGGFDWRFGSTEHAEARRDTTTAQEGVASWLVTFDGKENVDYAALSHWFPVTQGQQYMLTFWMKTEGITTNEGVFMEVEGQASEKQMGTTYWRQFTIPFTASSNLATLRLRRMPSKKFDNLLKGKVWLDNFGLTEVRKVRQ